MHSGASPRLFPLALLILLPSCSSYTYLNKPESAAHAPNQTRAAILPLQTEPPEPPDSLADQPASPTRYDPRDDGAFVGVAVSGGGSRSANFAAACMLHLQDLGILSRADYISSVSGGSITAADYCLSDPASADWSPDKVRKRFAYPFATEALAQFLLLPWESALTFFTDYDRSDILAEVFRRHLYSRHGHTLTFADLRPDRPHLIINATDLQTGGPFTFCNETFDALHSDLATYPMAHAVVASSAVPGALHQVTLRDFSYVPPADKKDQKRYVHLLDGGIVDNLGLQALLDTYQARTRHAREHGLPDPFPRGAVIIAIDAMNHADPGLSHKGDAGFLESLLAGADVAATVLLSGAGSTTLEHTVVRNIQADISVDQLRAQIQQLETTGYLKFTGRDGRPIRLVHIALARVKDLPHPPSREFNRAVNDVPTSFNISTSDRDNLYLAADLLMKQQFETKLEQLVEELDETGNTSGADR